MSFRTWALLATAVFGASACAGGAGDDTAVAGARDDTVQSTAGGPDTRSSTQASAATTTPATARVQPVARESVPTARPSPARGTTFQTPARHVVLGDIDLTGVGYDVGDHVAPVVVIDFSDFGCPYCEQFTRETYPVLEREYVQMGQSVLQVRPLRGRNVGG